MKFAYVDETGSKDESDIFVMVGVLVDAYRLRKHTVKFDRMIDNFLKKHPGLKTELKTKRMINGVGGWSKVGPEDRKKFLRDVCDLAAECATVFAIGFSFEKFEATAAGKHNQPFGKSYWLAAATFIAALIQQKMQKIKKNKGLTVLVCDDNKYEMQNLSDTLHDANPWFDPLYTTSKTVRGKVIWNEVLEEQRFDHIVNTAFAIKSHHSSLIQVADAVAYIHRRHLELMNEEEKWEGEKKYFSELVDSLPKRERLGRNPGGPCVNFYEAARHKEWAL